MKNSLGNPARGDAFYNRKKEISRIYKILDTGTSIYLSAPRRVGKTSILKYLEEFPKENYYFIYVITESVDNSNDFFKAIFEELIKSDAIKKLEQISSSIKNAITSVLGRVKSIYKVELREGEESDYYEILVELLSQIKAEFGRVVIMVDEFPQTIQNVLDKADNKTAETFIQKNRELRHHKHVHDKINFIYTGSVSLFPMIEKVTSLTSINDLRTVEVNPLTHEQAMEFIRLLMENEEFSLNEDLINYILKKVSWLIPFHLQLIQQEIVDVYESTGEAIDPEAVDLAYEQIIHTRNKPQFEPYFSRLAKIFKGDEHDFALEVLMYTAQNETIDKQVLSDKSVKYRIDDINNIMNILEGDGYLFKTAGIYRYTSPILQSWCKKHICK
jgi:hypothetical protein